MRAALLPLIGVVVAGGLCGPFAGAVRGDEPAGPKPPIAWRFAPAVVPLDGVSALRLPAGCIYAQGPAMQAFLRATGNTLTGDELAVVGQRDLVWFAIVSRAPRSQPGVLEEFQTEPDGRQVVLRTLRLASGDHSLQFDILAERHDVEAARAATSTLRASLCAARANTKRPPAVALWGLGGGALLGLAAVAVWRGRRYARGR